MKTNDEMPTKVGSGDEATDAEAQGWFMPDCPCCGSARHVIREDIAGRAIAWARGNVHHYGSPRFKCCSCNHVFSL